VIARGVFGATAGAYAMLLLIVAGLLPGRVPMHFDASGDVDRWAGRTEAVVTFGLVGLFVVAALGGTAAAAGRIPLSLVNVPHKSWWTAEPARERRMREMLRVDMYRLGTATLIFFGVLVVLTVRAARLATPHLDAWLWVAVGLYLAVVVGLLVHDSRVRYRPEPAG